MEKCTWVSVIVTVFWALETTNLLLVQKVKISWHSQETSERQQ